ncbi:MAG TPA: cytochrome c oxidase subunit 3 [Kofleriaceae bacterium]|nr:cytochrome c oxidase subunit 3 [Kofleriaceae bacterium]
MTADKAHEEHEHGHGHGSVFIQHHYDDAVHQFDSGKLGIWIFLAQEVLFFSALFVAYILYRHHHPEIYGYAHKYLDVKYGAINTAVLIFSSLTAAWAVRAAQLGQKNLLIACLSATILCALTFLGIKYIEYSHKVHEHILFGRYFDPCVSSGNGPLLTKNNLCPGTKGSVIWDYSAERPQTGCLADLAIDQEPREGVQAKCEVFESKIEIEQENGQPKMGKDGGWIIKQTPGTKIVNECPELTPEYVHSHGEGAKYPCWRISKQPAVCRPGWFFTARCTAGTCNPSFEASPAFKDRSECTDGKLKRDKELKKDKAGETWVVSDCTRSEQSGVVVEYGDHEEREREVGVIAKCDAPPAPKATGDQFAEPERKPAIGEKAISATHELSTHEEHERSYLGPPPDHTNMFFTIYFAMTGLHGIHVLVGVFVFIWLLIRAIKGHFTADYFGPVDFAALYWHIVDLIWIFLFPLLYLIH